jgi:hypothetical protein
MNYKERVMEEAELLSNKIDLLGDFINSEDSLAVDNEQYDLLVAQIGSRKK